MNAKFQPLFERFTFRSGIDMKNRLAMAPMSHFSSNPDGTVTDVEVEYYVRRSKGVGMVITAGTNVSANGKGFIGQFGADTDEMIPGLRRLADAIKAQGSIAVLQIFHGGSECAPDLMPNGETLSASAVPNREGTHTPRAMTEAEIEEVIRAFGETTRRAIEAGFDGVEIHGANGYLLHQFFSPHSNRREDKWGGSIENRMRFPLAIIDAVQQAIKAHAKRPFLVGYRFSPEEEHEIGFTMADTLELVDTLADKSLDYLHISLLDFWSKPRRGVDASRPRIEWVLEKVGNRVPVMGVGSIKTADDAAQALQAAPLVALGRELIIEPDWVEKVAEGREADIQTTLTKNDQQRLVVPDPLWQAIINTPGWFPVVE